MLAAMSIKRSKQVSRGSRNRDDDLPSFLKPSTPPEPEPTWEGDVAGKPDEAFVPYALTSKFDKGALINHPKFGKGIVVRSEGKLIDVRFQDGDRKLGHSG
jgi:hypothetical protein